MDSGIRVACDMNEFVSVIVCKNQESRIRTFPSYKLMRRIKAKAHANTSLALNSSQHQQMQEEKEVTYFVSKATTNACSQIHPDSATMDTSSISLFSKTNECMVMTNTTIA